MMSKTHIAVGMATALAVTRPSTLQGCILAVAGGAIGGVMADCDTVKNDYKCDALLGEVFSIGGTAILLLIDYLCGLGIITHIHGQSTSLLIFGAIIFLTLYIWGFCSEHRRFTHSLLATGLFSLAVYLMCDWLALPFLIGYISHLMIDILNKKDIQLLYPSDKGICFGWCYASKTANTAFMIVGFCATGFLLLNSLALHLF